MVAVTHRGIQLLNPLVVNGATQSYQAKVLSYSPTAYWPLNEESGTQVTEVINGAGWHGTYSGVTVGNGTGPDGQACPLFDGVNDLGDIFTASLQAAWDGDEGSLLIWSKVYNAAVWSDGLYRFVATAYADEDNRLMHRKLAGADDDVIAFRHRTGGVNHDVEESGQTSTDWICWLCTWSKSANQIKLYQGGGTPQVDTCAQAWIGNLTQALIGAYTVGYYWYGWLAHMAIWCGTVLDADDALALATA